MISEIFERITQPVLVGCYYSNKAEQDNVVSLAAIRAMIIQLGTETSKHRLVEFPEAGASSPI